LSHICNAALQTQPSTTHRTAVRPGSTTAKTKHKTVFYMHSVQLHPAER
jgi:hypothetical protein